MLDVVGPQTSINGKAVTTGKSGNIIPTAFCQDHPELDKLHLEKSNKHNEPGHRMDLNSDKPALQGEFKAGNGWQTIKLDEPQTGRYFALECESNHEADSEKGNSTLDKMFDLQESTYWQTEKGASFPHLGIVDMGKTYTVSAIEYLPRAEQGAPGSVKGFKLYIKK